MDFPEYRLNLYRVSQTSKRIAQIKHNQTSVSDKIIMHLPYYPFRCSNKNRRNLRIAIVLVLVSVGIIGSTLLMSKNQFVESEESAKGQSEADDIEIHIGPEEKLEEIIDVSLFPSSSTKYPTFSPTIMSETLVPSSRPTHVHTYSPSKTESSRPTRPLSTAFPSLSSSDFPTQLPSQSPSTQREDKFENIQFYVMGDIPYSTAEEKVFESQLQRIEESISAKNDTSIFIVHVGDLMSAQFSKCSEDKYGLVSTIFKQSVSIPVLTTPGDNEWNKCPDIDAALNNYTKYFVGMENHWKSDDANTRNSIFENFERSRRPENWAFTNSNILFIAMNMVEEHWSGDQASHTRIQENIDWFHEKCDMHNCESSRAIIIFGHSISNAHVVFEHIHRRVGSLQIPVVYFTGNGHTYLVKRGVGNGEISGDYFWRIQVDNGMKGAPILVTLRGNANTSPSSDLIANEEGQHIYGELMKIDRRLWENVTML